MVRRPSGADRTLVDDFVVRFQQTCGPVMAKGIEDTAFYRWARMTGANEVGGHPSHLSIGADDFHDFAARQLVDVAVDDDDADDPRHQALRGRPGPAHDPRRVAPRSGRRGCTRRPISLRRTGTRLLDDATEYLVWQTVLGAWPITPDRIETYVLKAVREAKDHTAWVDGDADYEAAVVRFARAVVADPAVVTHVETWLSLHGASVRANVLGQKLLQLVAVGVPDVYQGAELQTLTLVDPDNRGAVDYDERTSTVSPASTPVRRRATSTTRSSSSPPPRCAGAVSSRGASSGRTRPTEGWRRRRRTPSPWPEVTRPVPRSSRSSRGRPTGSPRLVASATQTVALPDGQWRNLLSEQHN